MTNLLWAFADQPEELNTSYHRCLYPARILAEQRGHSYAMLHINHLIGREFDPEVQKAVDRADVIILERLLLKEIQPRIIEWQLAGKRVVGTFDDAYHLMPPSGGPPTQTWRGGKNAKVGKNVDGSDKLGSILIEFRQTLRLLDTALVPSRVLAEDYRPYCPTIQFCPNVPYAPLWQNLKKRPPDNNFVIGWGGSTAHDISWRESALAPALGLIGKKYPRVHIHLQTRDPRILILLDKANLQGRYTSSLWCPFEVWPQVVNHWDLAVAPLSGEYDRRRSSLKQWEAGMARIPFVGTDLEPYREGRGSILVENRAQAWAGAIASLIDLRDKYEQLAQENYEWAMSLYEGAGVMYEKALGI